MRGTQVVLFIATLILFLSPAVMGARTLPAAASTRGTPFLPQLMCEVLFEAAGTQRCFVDGPLFNANELRITMGGAGSVLAWADDITGPHGRQLVVASCTASCVVDFPLTSSSRVRLDMNTGGAQGTSITVAIDRKFDGMLV